MSRVPFAALGTGRAARGVTLIELLVTMTLLGLLTSLGFPAFSAWIRNAQVRSVGEALQNGLRLAQAEALRQNRPVVMVFTNTTTSPAPAAGTAVTWTAAANGKNWWLQTIPQYGETVAQFITGGTFTDVASPVTIASPTAVCFNSNGRVIDVPNATIGVSGASCSAAALTTFSINQPSAAVSRGDRNLNVTLRVGGQVRLCDPNRPALSTSAPDGC